MDILTFIASLVASLAWPMSIAAMVIVALIKAPSLARFVKTIRYKDLEVTIREKLEAAREEAEKLPISAVPSPSTTADDKTIQLAKLDPSLAILDIWKQLEAKVIALMQHNGLVRFTRPADFVAELASQGLVSEVEFRLFNKLRQIRNTSVHSPELALSLAEVVEFKNLAERVSSKIDQLRELPGYVSIKMPPKPEA